MYDIKLLEENISVHPHHLELGNSFSDMTQKAQASKSR